MELNGEYLMKNAQQFLAVTGQDIEGHK